MFQIDLAWKDFNVNLEALEAQLRNSYPDYTGCSADTDLTLWFKEEPGEEVRAELATLWNNIQETSPEATSYVSAAAYDAALKALRAGIPGKPWDSLTLAEQKVVVGQAPTYEELGLVGG